MGKCLGIQFIHPSAEHTIKTGTNWYLADGKNKHRRKFLKIEGSYIDKNKLIVSDLVFWSELEAPCKIIGRPFAHKNRNFPKIIFEPEYNKYTEHIVKNNMNSDPFFFGNQFYYGICKQLKKKKGTDKRINTSLSKLEENTIILFGSKIKGNFRLDSLFVVDKGRECNLKNYNSFKNEMDLIAFNLNILPIFNGDHNEEFLSREEYFTLYSGKMYNGKNEIYSFSPCKKYFGIDLEKSLFERPIIKSKYLNQSLSRNYEIINFQSENELKYFWLDIKKQVENRNLHLMVRNSLCSL